MAPESTAMEKASGEDHGWSSKYVFQTPWLFQDLQFNNAHTSAWAYFYGI